MRGSKAASVLYLFCLRCDREEEDEDNTLPNSGHFGSTPARSFSINETADLHTLCHSLSELRSCVRVEVAVLGSKSLLVRTVFVDVKQHCSRT